MPAAFTTDYYFPGYQNGSLIYSSDTPPAYPLLLDSAFYTPNAALGNAYLCGTNVGLAPAKAGPPTPGAPTPDYIFPAGSVRFDCALIMRNVAHEWHAAEDLHQDLPFQAANLEKHLIEG